MSGAVVLEDLDPDCLESRVMVAIAAAASDAPDLCGGWVDYRSPQIAPSAVAGRMADGSARRVPSRAAVHRALNYLLSHGYLERGRGYLVRRAQPPSTGDHTP